MGGSRGLLGGRGAGIATAPLRFVLIFLFCLLLGATVGGIAFAGNEPKDGKYAGKTEQGEKVKFKVDNGAVENPKFTIIAGPCEIKTEIGGSDEVSDNGKFSVSGGTATFKGEFVSSKKAKGKASVASDPASGCPGAKVRYEARR
jgi:hypothetical protein